jgi:hypothetical protein
MDLVTTYQGEGDPFEGDQKLWLRSLPDGAQVRKATVKLTPRKHPTRGSFGEVFVFAPAMPSNGELVASGWGLEKILTARTVEVDFHARRTLAEVAGSGGASTLQVDMGGVYVGIADDGTILGSDGNALEVDLSSDLVELPGLAASKFKLLSTASALDVTRVAIRSVPTNVSARLGEMPPFWTQLGELVTPKTSPDFASVLNAFLAEAAVEDGFYAVPLVVRSEAIARLDVTLAIAYMIEGTVLPAHLPEATLAYGYSSLPGMGEPLTVALPRGAAVTGTGGAVAGTFDGTRVVHGEIGSDALDDTAIIAPGRTLAQPIRLSAETPTSGIDLPLGNTTPGLAGLHMALQSDADGKPSGEVLTSAVVTVGKPVPGGSAWGSAALPAEFRFLADKRYWLVLQSLSGKAYWSVAAGTAAAQGADEPAQGSTNGGLSWRVAVSEKGRKPLAAGYRLRHTPERFTVPVQLEVGEGAAAVRARFDRYAPLGRVEFEIDFAAELGSYLSDPALAPPCGSGDLLVNGGFADPPPSGGTEAGERRIWCKPEVPAGWQGVPGRVFRYQDLISGAFSVALVALDLDPNMRRLSVPCFAPDPDVLEVLTGEPAVLSQRLAIREGCTYLLQARFEVPLGGEENVLPPLPQWEVRWLDADGASVDSEEGAIPFETVRFRDELPFRLHERFEAGVTAPAGAVQAEVHLTQLASAILFLNEVSFSPTLEAVHNGGFGQWREADSAPVPLGWELLSGFLEPALEDGTGQPIGLTLRGGFVEDGALAQRAAVSASAGYEVEVWARPVVPPADEVEERPAQERARLALRWLADGEALGETVMLPLDGRGFPTRHWAGTAPAGATEAEIRLVQPRGQGKLSVGWVSLSQADPVPVPLTFLSEAPGELTVSGLRVTYDPPARPARRAPTGARAGVALRAHALLASRPVDIVNGVGPQTLRDFPASIATVGDLAALDPEVEIAEIERDRRLELRTAAELIVGLDVEVAPFSRLADEGLEELVALPPTELARRAGQPVAEAAHLQRTLRVLRLLIKKEDFQRLRLSDLMPEVG